VSEGFNVATAGKARVSEFRLSTGSFPASNLEAGMPGAISSTLVSALAVGAGGGITISYTTRRPVDCPN
jgi:hypothetical protein